MNITYKNWMTKRSNYFVCSLVIALSIAIPIVLYWLIFLHSNLHFFLVLVLSIISPYVLVGSLKLIYHLVNYLNLLDNRIEVGKSGLTVQTNRTEKIYTWEEIKEFKLAYFGYFYCAIDNSNDFIFVISKVTYNFESIVNQTAERRDA